MKDYEIQSALTQLEGDLVDLNRRDRDEIDRIQRRMKGRSRIIKHLRRMQRNRGMVRMPIGDDASPYYLHKRWLKDAGL